MSARQKRYPHVGVSPDRPPDFARVARSLSDEDLEVEILGRKGEREYQLALLAEAERRALLVEGAP